MAKQQNIFRYAENVTVNNYAAPPGESKTSPVTLKLTHTERETLKEFCFKHDIALSDFLRQGALFLHCYFEHANKLNRYAKAVQAMLDGLP